jgi:hypothetical protein
MNKIDFKNWAKNITLEKWLILTPHKRRYEHPHVTPSNMGANLTSLKRHKPSYHTPHKLLHQIDED